jgi:anti-sigma B factor antagonist
MPDATNVDSAFARELGTLWVDGFRDGDTHVVELAGEFDIAGVAAVEHELARAEDSDARVIVLDLRKVAFIDSSGLRVVVLANRRQPGRLVVVRGPRRVQRVFELCDLVKLLPFVDERSPGNGAAGGGDGEADAPKARLVAGMAAVNGRAAAMRRVDQAALVAAVHELCARSPAAHVS